MPNYNILRYFFLNYTIHFTEVYLYYIEYFTIKCQDLDEPQPILSKHSPLYVSSIMVGLVCCVYPNTKSATRYIITLSNKKDKLLYYENAKAIYLRAIL